MTGLGPHATKIGGRKQKSVCMQASSCFSSAASRHPFSRKECAKEGKRVCVTDQHPFHRMERERKDSNRIYSPLSECIPRSPRRPTLLDPHIPWTIQPNFQNISLVADGHTASSSSSSSSVMTEPKTKKAKASNKAGVVSSQRGKQKSASDKAERNTLRSRIQCITAAIRDKTEDPDRNYLTWKRRPQWLLCARSAKITRV